ncbi:hypothetical protein ACTMU2_39790 [Cupriavidus basilensis]
MVKLLLQKRCALPSTQRQPAWLDGPARSGDPRGRCSTRLLGEIVHWLIDAGADANLADLAKA